MRKYQEGGFTQTYGGTQGPQTQQDYLLQQLQGMGMTGLDPTLGLQGQLEGITPETFMDLIILK